MPPATALAVRLPCAAPEVAGALLRVVAAPVSLPPYDDELPDPSLSTDRTRPDATGHHARLLPLEMPRAGVSPRPSTGRLPRPTLLGDPTAEQPERLTPTAALPAPAPTARALVQVLLEVLSGDRPVAQLQRSVSPDVLTAVTRRAAREATRRSPGLTLPRRSAVRTVHVSEPADGVAEVSVVVQRGPRTAAVALRLEGHRGAWRAVELVLV